MNDDKKREVALFRLAVLGDLVHTELRRGALRRALEKKTSEPWVFPDGKRRALAAKTIQSWLLAYRKHGFDALLPKDRKDRGSSHSIPVDGLCLLSARTPGDEDRVDHHDLTITILHSKSSHHWRARPGRYACRRHLERSAPLI